MAPVSAAARGVTMAAIASAVMVAASGIIVAGAAAAMCAAALMPAAPAICAAAAIPAAAAVLPAIAVLPVPRRRPLPRIDGEHVPRQPLPGPEGVVQLAHAAEDEHRCVGIQRGVPHLLLAEWASAPVRHLRVRETGGGED